MTMLNIIDVIITCVAIVLLVAGLGTLGLCVYLEGYKDGLIDAKELRKL